MLFVVSLIVNVGMWLERFVIVVTSLHRDYVPAAWGMYYPTIWDWSTYIRLDRALFSLLFLFIRLLPMISIFEMRELIAEIDEREQAAAAAAPAGADGGRWLRSLVWNSRFAG